jgi:hypothetical protein
MNSEFNPKNQYFLGGEFFPLLLHIVCTTEAAQKWPFNDFSRVRVPSLVPCAVPCTSSISSSPFSRFLHFSCSSIKLNIHDYRSLAWHGMNSESLYLGLVVGSFEVF